MQRKQKQDICLNFLKGFETEHGKHHRIGYVSKHVSKGDSALAAHQCGPLLHTSVGQTEEEGSRPGSLHNEEGLHLGP